jgi:hypothetical protein
MRRAGPSLVALLGIAGALSAAQRPAEIQFGRSIEVGRQAGLFGSIASVCEDREGNFYVLDGKELAVFKFSSRGRLLQRFGRRGQGPGDFQSPSRIVLTSQSELAVSEDLYSISFFKTDGTFIRRVKLNGLLSPACLGPDRYVGWVWEPDSRRQVLVDGKNKRLASLAAQPRASFSTSLADETGRAVMFSYSSPAYVPELVFAYGGDVAAVGLTTSYRLTLLDRNGRAAGLVKSDIEPARISSRERAYLEAEIREFARSRNWPPAAEREIRKKIPATKTLIQAVRVSPRNIFVFRTGEDVTREDAGRPLDIFSLQGNFLGSTVSKAIPTFAGAKRMYFVETDDSGYEYLTCRDYSLLVHQE